MFPPQRVGIYSERKRKSKTAKKDTKRHGMKREGKRKAMGATLWFLLVMVKREFRVRSTTTLVGVWYLSRLIRLHSFSPTVTLCHYRGKERTLSKRDFYTQRTEGYILESQVCCEEQRYGKFRRDICYNTSLESSRICKDCK